MSNLNNDFYDIVITINLAMTNYMEFYLRTVIFSMHTVV